MQIDNNRDRLCYLENSTVPSQILLLSIHSLPVLPSHVFTFLLHSLLFFFYRYDSCSLPPSFALCPSDAPFCKFSALTLCQVEGRGHPGVNCLACDGWRKAQSNFHTISQQGPQPLLPNPVGTSNKKETASQTAWRRLGGKRAARGKGERRYHGLHFTSSQSHLDCSYCFRF